MLSLSIVTPTSRVIYASVRARVSRHATLLLCGVMLRAPTVLAQDPIDSLSRIVTAPTITSIQTATQDYQRSGQARTIREGDFRIVPYGKTQPTLQCAILRTCVIRLQAGERLTSPPALGDSERWLVGLLRTGPNSGTLLITVKPTACDLTTDLVLATDRHLYLISLDAPPCASTERESGINNPFASYTRHLAFYYPDEALAQLAAQSTAAAPFPAASAITPERFHFAYHIKKDRKFPWKPTIVFDDGVRTYIRIPTRAVDGPAPVLFVLYDKGLRAILNYTVTRDYYVADRVIDHAQLVLAEGGHEQRLTITRLASERR